MKKENRVGHHHDFPYRYFAFAVAHGVHSEPVARRLVDLHCLLHRIQLRQSRHDTTWYSRPLLLVLVSLFYYIDINYHKSNILLRLCNRSLVSALPFS